MSSQSHSYAIYHQDMSFAGTAANEDMGSGTTASRWGARGEINGRGLYHYYYHQSAMSLATKGLFYRRVSARLGGASSKE
ncbi:hypothetical protein LZ32DRAFT_610683 [Colletotrichum eremochloae]|nr:hypothetical protein LZ32DRAFT_610683 [Colletotrichum eremochloae]